MERTLYDMRITYPHQQPTDWYGPYALTDEDVTAIKTKNPLLIAQGRQVELREHACTETLPDGRCGHMAEGLPAPY